MELSTYEITMCAGGELEPKLETPSWVS